ncbi:zinc finger, CCCH type domain-containing protein [Cryptosporidium muris RN66]|uniref:Zinc finger, CCCH type domain-containing protein n=1 Tax=Cryptosporidium muris (strain RN66) TaxID=441375 RepID=B6AJI2_CRYMR|nr:zinc finger, CCCH type domain-containing protein [Cryptosporidium muris RN66]EEA08373.1 zinc finger, CCCH type domain-containing protein [Cryptosporidium muris RN66]|eukprot:XP_002142722.1 zinc finger, CCCH type domain-containing protein [Cryptosporidium muris RN66]
MPLSQNMNMTELSRFRTRICERKALHGVCELDERCPFSHCLSWHRRNPYEYAYRPNLCPNVVFHNENKKMRVKNYCQRGRMCMFSHTKEEQMYHVLVYKTQLCREYPLCTKHYCPFAHGLDELRNPESIDFDPVQGPEVIERQRLIHDSNKLSEDMDCLLGEITDGNLRNNDITEHSPIRYHKHLGNKMHGSNNLHSPKRNGRNSRNKNNHNESCKGETTPVNNNNDSPVTPSTGCETPLPRHGKVEYTCLNESPKSYTQNEVDKQNTDKLLNTTNSSRKDTHRHFDNSNELHTARDNIKIPPPPCNVLGLGFSSGDIRNLDDCSNKFEFNSLPWTNDCNISSPNNSNNTAIYKNMHNSNVNDDYDNGASLEQMSYLMQLQLLSLSDNPNEGNINKDMKHNEWHFSGAPFGLAGICGFSNEDSAINVYTPDLTPHSENTAALTISMTSSAINPGSNLIDQTHNYFEEIKCDKERNITVDSDKHDKKCDDNAWQLFHPNLFTANSSEKVLWTEGCWVNTSNY